MQKKKTKIWFNQLIMIGVLLLLTSSCKKKDDDSNNKPVLTTVAISNITQTSAISGGTITSDGGATVIEKGVCWSTLQMPTISDSKTTDGAGTGSFPSNIEGLNPNTTYYVRAYATNSVGTDYGNSVSFTTQQGVIDIDGNVYHIVTIGTQTWMVENLKTTKYRDGTAIPLVTDATAWAALSTGAYCNYNNDVANAGIYGRLYNYYAVVDAHNFCPSGWHIPADAEWTTLETFLGGSSVAGSKMKEAGTNHWVSPNTGATNESGFFALPGGYRDDKGAFSLIGNFGTWGSSTAHGALSILYCYLSYNSALINHDYGNKKGGYSVRCVKD